ncbi:MAG: bifunctional adenosylcobinamide kinase/adenosylcobinamide-phosphate guanylyltransferase, partial [Desulfonatronovibrio sp.]
TGKSCDLDFNEQIRRHKSDRNLDIPVVESGPDLGRVLESLADEADVILIDSIDFWVFSIFDREEFEDNTQYFIKVLDLLGNKRFIFVSAEIGLGPIPATSMVRRFVRTLGRINQQLSSRSKEVLLVVAGLPVKIK